MIPALCAAFFVCCMVCHGELARRKPHPRYLTQFYLMVSVGGAAGGLFVALIAPRVFHSYLELPVAMARASGRAGDCGRCGDRLRCGCARRWCSRPSHSPHIMAPAEEHKNRGYVLSARNFYGVLRVRDDAGRGRRLQRTRTLIHGTINHGTQLLGPGTDRIPTSYFGRESGISRAHPRAGRSAVRFASEFWDSARA